VSASRRRTDLVSSAGHASHRARTSIAATMMVAVEFASKDSVLILTKSAKMANACALLLAKCAAVRMAAVVSAGTDRVPYKTRNAITASASPPPVLQTVKASSAVMMMAAA
jgi:hypothetical protein